MIFSNKLFHFLTKFRIIQERKSHSCRISAIFFQCSFMIETQVLMAVSDFSGFFSTNHFLEGGFTFQLEGGRPMGHISFDGWGFRKKIVSFTHCLHSAYFAQMIILFPKISLPTGSNFFPVQSKEDDF